MNFRIASFPSDCLSVKRFRTIFPEHFDGEGRIADGYGGNDFFYPLGTEDPWHLVQLSDMIASERTIASGGFLEQFLDSDPTLLGDEELETLENAATRLEYSYQFFKLADSPETARLLISQVEEEGKNQALALKSRQR